MAEQKNKLPSGVYETPSETVARAKAQLASLNKSKGDATTDFVTGNSGSPSTPKPNPILEALTARLTEQGKGISTSSSSGIQSAIEDAIASTRASGDATAARLQSEREREMAYAQDRASSTFTSAQESGTGYATQVAAFRELTDTTEKSIRDLDKRYQEALLANDAETASQVSALMIQKLQFQQQQEQNYFSNLISVTGLAQQEENMRLQQEQFAVDQQNQQARFVAQMAQSNYQFEKNLAVSYKELDLKSQELEISRERNQISWAEYKLRKSELEKEKEDTAFTGIITTDLRNEVQKLGKSPDKLDTAGYAQYFYEKYAPYYPNMDFEKVLSSAEKAKSQMVKEGTAPFTEYTGPFESYSPTPSFTESYLNTYSSILFGKKGTIS